MATAHGQQRRHPEPRHRQHSQHTGGADPIVTRDRSLAMDTLVRSKDKTYLTIDGGYMGILGSKQHRRKAGAGLLRAHRED